MTVIRLDKYLDLGNSKRERNSIRSAYRYERVKELAALIGKKNRIIYEWANGKQHFVEYDVATRAVLAIRTEKVVWEAKC